MVFDTLVRGGILLDGTGGEPLGADVGIRGDTIQAIGALDGAEAARVLDAAGLAVAPGFIDIHAHGDLFPLLAPGAPARLHDGVTTEVLGNCGESPFPQSPAMLAERAESSERHGITVDWTTLDDYARRHDAARPGINRACLVGHGNIRQAVLGEADRAATEAELAAMRREVEAALDAGAFGLSSGLYYTPGMFARPGELDALCEPVARRGALYASHIRNEGDAIEEAIEEFVAVARHTGARCRQRALRLQLSHVKVSGRANWVKADRVIERLHAVRAEGIDIACDRYPYIASSTSLSSQVPGWAREGGRPRMLERLANPADRARMLEALAADFPTDDDWQALRIADPACDEWRRAEGCSLHDLAAQAGKPPAELLLDLLLASKGRASIVHFTMCEDNLAKWLRLPLVAIGSDSSSRSIVGPTAVGKPHPRSYGTCARVLGRYVRGLGILSLPEAVRRMTGLPASRLGLKRRGILRAGAAADITVFDPATIADRATYEVPQQYSVGVRFVLVNGTLAIEDGELTGNRAGRFLRRGIE
ncbi:MAG: D-aminoacylase [Planctomycetes bacterium]|nr:D-aminoacylase [Planctomycetota bacterium]